MVSTKYYIVGASLTLYHVGHQRGPEEEGAQLLAVTVACAVA